MKVDIITRKKSAQKYKQKQFLGHFHIIYLIYLLKNYKDITMNKWYSSHSWLVVLFQASVLSVVVQLPGPVQVS